MLATSARLLRLLSLLQAHAALDGHRARRGRLGVTTRTVRNDVERLRELGYPVDATPGVGGGYALGAGATLPPLLLDDEEAVAVAVGLRTAAGGAVTGIEETSVRALAKLEMMLPSRLRRRINAMQSYTVAIAGDGPMAAPAVDPSVLTSLVAVCRDHERLRFDYASNSGATARRTVEPFRLAHLGGRWYLVAYDIDAGRMADVPRRPHDPAHPDRAAVRAAATPARGVDRARDARGGYRDLGVPRQGAHPRAARGGGGPAPPHRRRAHRRRRRAL